MARPVGEATAPANRSVVEVEPGDTIEGLLRGLGFEDQLLTEMILGLSAEFDPNRLQPGHRLEVVWFDRVATEPERILLSLGEEIIELEITEGYRTETHHPDAEWTERAVSVTVENTLVEALDEAGAPTGLGLDLAAFLGGMVDFSRDIQGGETVEVLYKEEVLPDGDVVGRAELRYAKIEIGSRTLEVIRDGESGVPAQVFEDGKSVRLSAAPVVGARISSHFGRRKHPILGTVRMHSGVDYAAGHGTPVFASAPGVVSYVGSRGGYGRVVEIQHGADMMTRYAHLSDFADGLQPGRNVEAGERIGAVGATGLATGPHLHYEVRYAGRPVDPLSDERVAVLADAGEPDSSEDALQAFREACAQALAAGPHT